MKKSLFVVLSIYSTMSFSGFWNDGNKANSPTNTKSEPQYELAVCSVDPSIEKNPLYYHLPSVSTVLLCDIGAKASTGAFRAFYNDGWRLIQIVKVDSRLMSTDKAVPYPSIYLERIKRPAEKVNEDDKVDNTDNTDNTDKATDKTDK